MAGWIARLDDAGAVATLRAFVNSTPWDAERYSDEEALEMVRDLARDGEHELLAVTDGELARAALAFLYREPGNRPRLDQLAEPAELESFGILETLGLATAVLVVLQTHVRLDRDKQGKVRLFVEKRPTDPKSLETLIHKLLAWSSADASAR